MTLRVRRDGTVKTIVARPEYDPAVGRTRLGFSYGETPANLSVGGALDRSTGFIWLVTHKTVTVWPRGSRPRNTGSRFSRRSPAL